MHHRVVGLLDPGSTFHAENLPLEDKPGWFRDHFDRVLKVHRLREVMALIGFTRLEPIVRGVDGDPIDQLDIGAKRADINNKELDWVPAIENFGEGLFLGVSESVLQAWIETASRTAPNIAKPKLWNRDHGLKADEFTWPGASYLMLHSLAHLLITTAALECGYGLNWGKDLQLSELVRDPALHQW